MSIESARAYIERLKTDEDFRNRVKDAKDDVARLALAKAEGFDFSEEDMKAATAELSAEEFDVVSGWGWAWQDILKRSGP